MGNVLYALKADLFCYLMTLAIEKHFEIYILLTAFFFYLSVHSLMEERAKIFTQLLTTHELPYACFKNENFIIFGDFLNEFKKFNKMHDNGRRFGGGERSSIVSSMKNNYHIYHFYVFFSGT